MCQISGTFLAGRRAACESAHVMCRVERSRSFSTQFIKRKKQRESSVFLRCSTSTHNSQRPFHPRISPCFFVFVFGSLLHIACSPPIRYQKFSASFRVREPLGSIFSIRIRVIFIPTRTLRSNGTFFVAPLSHPSKADSYSPIF